MLTIEHLTKHYPGTQKGITDLTLHVEPGDLYAFIGHNGAGKTTTLKAISGIHSFDTGTVLVDGISVKDKPLEAKSRMAYIPDNPDLYDFLTGIQYLSFIGDVFRVPAPVRKERIERYGEEFGITDALNDLIGSYSHGMKQKLAILSALIHAPRLLILDEPFVGLDPMAVFAMKKIMHELCEAGGAVFFSTHVLDVAEKLCNKVAIVKDGKLVASGTMDQIMGQADSLESVFMEVETNDENSASH